MTNTNLLKMDKTGNGILVKTNVLVNGKEKSICHITKAGRMQWYTNSKMYADSDVNEIACIAEHSKICTERYVDLMLKTDEGYFKLVQDICSSVTPYTKVLQLVKTVQNKSQEEQKSILKKFYMENM